MSNSINWMGNKVFDPGAARQMPQPNATQIPMQQGRSGSMSVPMEQGQPGTMSVPMQQGRSGSMSVPMEQGQPDSTSVPMQQDRFLSPMTSMQPGGYDMSDTQQGPPPSTERGFIPYYLTSNIGKSVRAEFIIGTSQYTDKTGVLSEVGINYFVLRDVNSRTNIMCDLYSVKFVTILEG